MYTIFDSQGRPVRKLEVSGFSSKDEARIIALNTGEGERVAVGEYIGIDLKETHYLNNLELPTPIPKSPSPYHKWDWGTKTHVGPYLDEARDEVWERIKSERSKRWASGFAHAGHWWHSDEASRLQYLTNKDTARDQLDEGDTREAPLRNLATGEQVIWKAMDGLVPLTVGLALDVAKAAKVHEAQVFAAAEQHRAAVMASDDPYAYDYSGGWPAIFEGGEP